MVAADYSSKSSESAKVQLNSHMLATISGGSERLLQELKDKCNLQEQTEGKKTPVSQVLKWLAESLEACEEELPIGILLAVWNESEHGLYCMNGKGKVVEDDRLATGSGACGAAILWDRQSEYVSSSGTNSYGLQSRIELNMPVSETAELARRALCIGTYTAPHTGDCFSVYHLGDDGCNKILEGDIVEWQNANIKTPRQKYKVIGKGW